nr:PREDICTED: vacuolar protein sorting-associated protein 72 homolog [Bemisia tabaci]
MASSRERRSNAGNRLAKLLNEEEEDEFYKTTYGGFDEVEDDNDYKSEEEVEDDVDSDFSIDENDEPVSDQETEESKKRKKMVYKEPKVVKKTVEKTPKPPQAKTDRKKLHYPSSSDILERKSIRHSTAVASAKTQQRVRERSDLKRKISRKYTVEVKLTQEELLEEAKLTEIENLRSLEKYQMMEIEKKKNRGIKKIFTGPVIRYLSTTMPDVALEEETICVDEDVPVKEETKSEESKADSSSCEQDKSPKKKRKSCYERTFLIFTDALTFHDSFYKHFQQSQKPHNHIFPRLCPITGMPAKYVDPVTNVPYDTAQSFKIIRELYAKYLETNGNRDIKEVAEWLEWHENNSGSLLVNLTTPDAATSS